MAVLLIGFVGMAIGVISRRTYGLRERARIAELAARRDSLAVTRSQLEAEVRDASSRTRLGRIAEERLNMHVPKPENQIVLPRSSVPNPAPPPRP